MNNIEYNPFDEIEMSPQDTIDIYKNKSDKNPFDELDFDEDFWSSAIRWGAQVPQALLGTTRLGLLAGLWEMMAVGEIDDPDEIEHLKMISEREGVPFDEEAFMSARDKALGGIPTVSNIASKVEEKTGLPLEPKTRGQKALRFFTEASRLAPEDATIRGMNTKLPKPILGAAIEGTKEVLIEAGVPEAAAEIASFAILKTPSEGAGSLKLGKEKSSGMKERGFESLTEPTEVSQSRFNKINQTVKQDFDTLSKEIIKESPVGETATNLIENPSYKQQTRELLKKAQEIADNLNAPVSAKDIKKEFADISAKKQKGFLESEYDKEYNKFMKEAINNTKKDTHSGGIVEQYRKNNDQLTEYFEPGSSKSLNRAKKDALLDQNRAIASLMEKKFPESELVPVFKEGNERWSKIMDVEMVDDFLGDVFSGEKINHKKLHDFFDKPGYEPRFKRALGSGYKDFENLIIDTLSSEKPYNMLKIAKEKGYGDLFKHGLSYIIHPKLGLTKTAVEAVKSGYRGLINATLDKPKLGLTYTKAVKDLKAGKFAEAEKGFKSIDKEVNPEIINKIEKPKTNKNLHNIDELNLKFEDASRKVRRLQLEASQLPERNSGKWDAGVEYDTFDRLNKAMEEQMKILTKIKNQSP